MSTASTKRSRKKGRQQRPQSKAEAAAEETRAPLGDEVPERVWRWAAVLILATATALRFYALSLKPMHHDEGVNGFFLTNLLNGQGYSYDPQNYHGPSLYFMTAPLAWLGGVNELTVRGLVATFGVGTVLLVLALRRRLGAVAALSAAALVAVSPGAVYYSRYYIHETPFVFFALAVVVTALRFQETGAAAQLMLCALSAALLFTTKETAFISLGTVALAALVATYWVRLTGGRTPREARRGRPGGGSGLRAAFARMGEDLTLYVAGAALVFAVVYVLLYTSFLTNPKGLKDSFAALTVWKQTGESDFHAKPFHFYVRWLLQEEGPILLLAAAGSAVALFERWKNRSAIFVGAWGFGLLLAYSLIRYKTPWLVLSFLVPLCLAAGYGVQALGRAGWWRLLSTVGVSAVGLYVVQDFDNRWRAGAGLACLVLAVCLAALWARRQREVSGWDLRASALVLGLAASVCLWQSAVLNFREYDNEEYPYVYSHTRREALELVRRVKDLGARAERKPRIIIASPEYWPLPWYLKDVQVDGYGSGVASNYDPLTVDAVVGRQSDIPKENQVPQLRTALGANYELAGTYALRPGVTLVLFVRRDLLR